LGIGDWGLAPIPNPQIPNPQSPIPNPQSPSKIKILKKENIEINKYLIHSKHHFIFIIFLFTIISNKYYN